MNSSTCERQQECSKSARTLQWHGACSASARNKHALARALAEGHGVMRFRTSPCSHISLLRPAPPCSCTGHTHSLTGVHGECAVAGHAARSALGWNKHALACAQWVRADINDSSSTHARALRFRISRDDANSLPNERTSRVKQSLCRICVGNTLKPGQQTRQCERPPAYLPSDGAECVLTPPARLPSRCHK